MGSPAKSSREERSETTWKEIKSPILKKETPDSHPAASEMEADTESRGFEDSRHQHHLRSSETGAAHLRSNQTGAAHLRSNQRRNGIVEPPTALTDNAEEEGRPNERQRRNAISGAPFLHAFLASPQHQTDDSRSR